MRLLVCGGRNFGLVAAERLLLTSYLDKIQREIDVLIVGDAKGADQMAREWAKANSVKVKVYSAEWWRLGCMAGPVRNARMLQKGKPDKVAAFPGGAGTRDCVKQAEELGIPVEKVRFAHPPARWVRAAVKKGMPQMFG